jgi:serine protease Do
MSTRKTSLFYAVLLVVASLAVGMVIASRLDLTPNSSAQMVAMPAMNSAPLGGPIDATTFRNIAKAQTATVVNIRTESRQRTQDLTEFFGGGGGGDDLLRRFFGEQAPNNQQGPNSQRTPRGRRAPEQLTQSAGTGFIIDRSGYILTNNHVVEGAVNIKVSFAGADRNEEYAAKIIGRDELTDSALIQLTELPAEPLQEARFGDSSQMQQGDWVVAIGNPFGLGHTVTVGVVSALGRTLQGSGVAGREQPMLQTDAAINPGNSGGPLLNVRGEVVGINTAIYTDQRLASNIGIGFATPINTIRDLLPQLRTGKITRGRMGVRVRPDHITKQEAAALGLPNTNGAIMSRIEPDAPADKAGVEPGDVIVEFNGRPVIDSDSLVSMVIGTKPGSTVPITVYRDKQRKTLNVTIEELDLDAERAGRRPRPSDDPSAPTPTDFGMVLEPITPEIARQLELPRGRGGAVVADVDRGSAASYAGVVPGDVILEVNRQPVSNVSQVTRALQNAGPRTPVFLLVWRDGQQNFLTMTKR